MISSWKTLDERRKIIRQRVIREIPAGVEISDRELDVLIGKHGRGGVHTPGGKEDPAACCI